MAAESAVYVMGTMRGHKKVGYAAAPRRRLSSIRRSHGRGVALLEEWPMDIGTAANVEAVAHLMLWDRRIRGEWFRGSLETIGDAIDAACGVVEDAAPEIDLHEIRRVAGAERSRIGREIAMVEGRLRAAKWPPQKILEFAKSGIRPGAREAGLSVPGFQKALIRARKWFAEQEIARRARRKRKA